MIGSLYNAMSGVVSFEKGINVTANNIANVNTLGYKADEMNFARMMYDSSNTAGAGKVGNGVGTMEVQKDFDQGQLKQSSTYYDFAIDGRGFFAVNDVKNDDIFYTRGGNFQKSWDGFLEDKNGYRVQGIQTDITSTSSINGDTAFSTEYIEFIASKTIGTEEFTISINARSNDFKETATDIGTSGDHFKTKGTLLADIDVLRTNYNNKLSEYASNPNAEPVASTNQVTDLLFGEWESDLDSEGKFIQIYVGSSVYTTQFETDALTTMKNLADKISNLPGYSASFDETTGNLQVINLVPGDNTPIDVPLGDYTAPTITRTAAIEGSGLEMVNSARDALQARIALAGGEFLEIQNTIPSPNQASVTLEDLDLKLANLGFTTDDDSTFEATGDGILLLNKLGNTYVIGRLSTVYFPDPISLDPKGSNLYAKTIESGEPKNADILNTIYSGFVEQSNTDLSVGFTNVLQQQRAFEANSKAITTSDEFLKTAINLKR